MLKLEKNPIEHLKNKISAIPYILSPEVILFIFVTAAFSTKQKKDKDTFFCIRIDL